VRLPAGPVVALALGALVGLAHAGSPMHPDVPLLDTEGNRVLETGKPVSPVRTCGQCHDAEFIEGHDFHATLGFDERKAPGTVPGGRPWDTSAGPFGRWDPATNRRLALGDETSFDLGVADWIRTVGLRHVGGGPARLGESGKPLGSESGSLPETHALDAATGRPVRWDWAASGTVELNCFLCHVAGARDDARRATLAAGRFEWAATATLAGTGLVAPAADGTYAYVREAFTRWGATDRTRMPLGRPTAAACGACHLDVVEGPVPVGAVEAARPRDPRSGGQVFSAQRVSDSAWNLRDKERRTHVFDVHAERLVGCTDCHHSLNDPARFVEADVSRPRHLAYDARRASVGEFVRRPSHDLAKGTSSRPHAASALDGTMRRCDACHDVLEDHGRWLPSARRHAQALSCEACHVPEVPAAAVAQTDWTVLDAAGRPMVAWRGVSGPVDDPASLVTGYQPVLLPRKESDGRTRLVPHTLETTWTWWGGSPERPVRPFDLRAALLAGPGVHHRDVLAALDVDRDGSLDPSELRLDAPAKVAAVRARLEAVGIERPRIVGTIEPTGLHHGIVSREATRSCEACHADGSLLARPFEVARYVPSGATTELVADARVWLAGRLVAGADGSLVYEPSPKEAGRYVLGHDDAGWIDRLGLLLLVGTALGVAGHAAARALAARRARRSS